MDAYIDFDLDDIDDIELDNDEKGTKILNLKKIKAVKFGDPIIDDSIIFQNYSKFIKVEDISHANLEADFSVSYLLSRYKDVFETSGETICLYQDSIGKEFIEKIYNNLKSKYRNSFNIGFNYDNKIFSISNFTLIMKKLILFHDGHSTFLMYDPKDLEDSKSPLHVFLGLVKSYKNPSVQKNRIYVVYRTDKGFQKKSFNVKKNKIDIKENYNDGFEDTSKEIITKLNNANKTGLVILHGDPGTGKTTYIRYLASKLKRDIIFISPDMVHHITSPEFIPFLMSNNNAILIIEDAEPALQKRVGDARTGAVSNILNMTDGLLSDCLNISIVATFNTSTKDIDTALLRKGRLLKAYKFDKLSKDKAQVLLDKIGNGDKAANSMSLAEIYFADDENDKPVELETKRVGFGAR